MTNKKDHHSYPVIQLGSSDIAQLLARSWDKVEIIKYQCDDSYSAYVVDEHCAIPAHYECVGRFTAWLSIYDDETRTADFKAKEINVYRAGDYGTIIQVIK